jgi:hypothetical protein
MNAEIGTVAAQFLFWDYLFRVYGIVSLQCMCHGSKMSIGHMLAFCVEIHLGLTAVLKYERMDPAVFSIYYLSLT